jgi:uncharacterized membrane protein
MTRPAPPLEALVERIEQERALDGVAGAAQGLLRRVIPDGGIDVLRGKPLGHPLHPGLVAVPIGAWTLAPLVDLMGDARAARRLTAIGCLSAIPAAACGAADWASTEGAQRRVGLVHALVNDSALTFFTLSWRARRRGDRGRGFLLSLVGLGLLSAGGWLGGHLAYSMGVGVDTTHFRRRENRTTI